MDERDDIERGYARVRTTTLYLLAASAVLTAVAAFVEAPSLPLASQWAYRIGFLAVAVVTAVTAAVFRDQLASGRPLRRAETPEDVAARVAALASLLMAMPLPVLLLGFALRVGLGGTLVDYLGFLGVTLAMWALLFPRRAEYASWVRSRTGGE